MTLTRIPGHAGIPSNEKADALAKIAVYGEKDLEKNNIPQVDQNDQLNFARIFGVIIE